MRGEAAAAREPLPHCHPRGHEAPPIDGEIVRGTGRELTLAHGRSAGVPGEDDPRVWDLCKPYLLPIAVCSGVGLFVVFGVLAALRWYTSEYGGPSQQQRFEALWGAHRRGDDLAPPETLEKGDESQAVKAPPRAAAPRERSPKTPPQPERAGKPPQPGW